MKIKINNIEYEAKKGETILDVCIREGIKIPRLCAHGKLRREAVCRLCLVEVNLTDKLVTSCTFPVCEKLEVITESEKIKKVREINMELLWADHAGKCVTCKKNRRCELQSLAEEYKIENFHFVPRRGEMTSTEENKLLRDNWSRVVVDEGNPVIARTTDLCVECRRCINICPVKSYGFNNRAGDVVVGTPYNKPLDCIFCGACVKHCPTGAITDQGNIDDIIKDLDDLNILSVAVIDPAVMESIGNELESVNNKEKIVSLLKELGFEKVFDLSWGMEQYIGKLSEEINSREFLFKKIINRRRKLKIASHCPAINLFIEKYYPELSNNIVKISNPAEIMAEAIKNKYAEQEKIDPEKIRIVSISSCTAKKKVKSKILDYVITVRELGRIVRKNNIGMENIKEVDFDKFLENYSEKMSRMTEFGGLTELLKERVETPDSPAGRQNFASVFKANSIEDIRKVLNGIRKREISADFLELMICPGGCIHGGGQSIKVKN